MKERFLIEFIEKLREKGIYKELSDPQKELIAWTITEKKRVRRHRAAAFRFSDRTAAALKDLADGTGASKTEVLEKLILVADILMNRPEWEEVDDLLLRERMDIITVKTLSILPEDERLRR